MTDTFYDYGIDVKGKTFGTVKTLCPKCSQARKKKTEPCLSVDIGKEVWNCHHCEWSGGLKNGNGHNGTGHKLMSRSRTIKKPELLHLLHLPRRPHRRLRARQRQNLPVFPRRNGAPALSRSSSSSCSLSISSTRTANGAVQRHLRLPSFP